MPLTDLEIRSLKPEVPRKVFDGRGLYLEVTAAGSKLWRLKYRFQGKENRLTLGSYPDVGLRKARERCDEARRLVDKGIDPSAERKAAKIARAGSDSFEAVAREWLAGRKPTWADNHYTRVVSLLENDVFPYLGAEKVSQVTSPQLLKVIRRVEKRVLERAHRALGTVGQIFRYAIATGRCERSPASDLKGALPPFKGKNFAAPTDAKQLAPLLRVMNGYQGSAAVMAAMRLAPLVFVRPGELRKALWEEVDVEAAEWRYVSSKTKQPHIVPLSRQAVAIFRELHPVTSRSRFVFPCATSNDRPMSDNAILAALRRSGVEKDQLTGHGLRATARTLLDEVLGFRPDIIEHQLAHTVKDPNGVSYNRTKHLDQRREMMQAWADYLDKITAADVLQFPKSA